SVLWGPGVPTRYIGTLESMRITAAGRLSIPVRSPPAWYRVRTSLQQFLKRSLVVSRKQTDAGALDPAVRSSSSATDCSATSSTPEPSPTTARFPVSMPGPPGTHAHPRLLSFQSDFARAAPSDRSNIHP